MILLQAAIGAGIFLMFLFGILLIVGVPLITTLLLKFWNKRSIEREAQLAKPNYKKPGNWGNIITAIIVGILIMIILFVIIIVILEGLFPSLE